MAGRKDSNVRPILPQQALFQAELRPERNRVIEGKQPRVRANCKTLDRGHDLVTKIPLSYTKKHERTNSREIVAGL